NYSVWFIIKRDKYAQFQLASLDSETGDKFKKDYGIPETLNSLILLQNERYYDRSSAVLHISKSLQGFWKLFYILIIIPKPIRDFFYNLVAKNRHKLFKNNACRIPTKEQRKRFL